MGLGALLQEEVEGAAHPHCWFVVLGVGVKVVILAGVFRVVFYQG